MFIRRIEEQQKILKQKPYLNFFHELDYEKDLRKCDNCFEGFTHDEMLYCESCNSFIHRACYSLSDDQYEMVNAQETEDEYNFTFIKCESCLEREMNINDNNQDDLSCFICRRNIGIMKCFLFDSRLVVYASKKDQLDSEYKYFLQKTPVKMPNETEIQKNNIKRVFAHTLCVNSCSCLFIYLFKLLLVWDETDYLKKKSLGEIHKCAQCHQKGGLLIQCEHSNKRFATCKEYYHPFCAAEKKLIYYQQGMRLIHQNSKVKYNQLTASDVDDSSTFYYVICRNHIQQIFSSKINSGFFSEKLAIYLQLKITKPEEQKNYDDWFEQMINEYEVSSSKLRMKDDQSEKTSSYDKSISQETNSNLNNSSMVLNCQVKSRMDSIINNLDQFIFKNKSISNDKQQQQQQQQLQQSKIQTPEKVTADISSNEIINLDSNKLLKDGSASDKKQIQMFDNLNIISSDDFQEITPKKNNLIDQQTPILLQDKKQNQQKLNIQQDQQQQQSKTKQPIQKKQESNKKEVQINYNDKFNLAEKVFTIQNQNQKNDFENQISQKKQISSEIYKQNNITKIQEQEKQKSARTICNTLKRELGIDLPVQPKSIKKKSKIIIKNKTTNDETQNEESQNDNSNNDSKNNDNDEQENEIEDENINNENDEDYIQDESETKKSQEQFKLRRSGRSKKTPNALDDKIYNIYEQKKSSLKLKDSNQKDTSKDQDSSNTDPKQNEQPKKSDKNDKKKKKLKVDPKNNKKNSKSKNKKDLSYFDSISCGGDDYNSDYSDSDSRDLNIRRQPHKKIKQSEDTLLINPEDSCKRFILFEDIVNSSDEQEINNKNNNNNKKNKKKTQLQSKNKQKNLNYRNIDKRDDEDETDDDENQNNNDKMSFQLDDSFSRILFSDSNENNEINEIDYVVDKLQEYAQNDKEYNNLEIEDNNNNEEDDDDCPLDLPDFNELFQNENQDDKIINQINSHINIVEGKITFLKEDSKLKKHSFLNEINYEQFHEQELNRLIKRKQLLEQQIQNKRSFKIEQYRQSLQYMNLNIDHNCIQQKSQRKILKDNINPNIPPFRLIRYNNNNNNNDLSNIIPLYYYQQEQEYEIVGFSNSVQYNSNNNKKLNNNNKSIHNFFNLNL